jgi:hypothetical protein
MHPFAAAHRSGGLPVARLSILEPRSDSAHDPNQREVTIALPRPYSVHLQYWTAWITAQGELRFGRDIYQRDQKVADALALQPKDDPRRAAFVRLRLRRAMIVQRPALVRCLLRFAPAGVDAEGQISRAPAHQCGG